MTLHEAPILNEQALDEALQIKVDELYKAINRFKLFRAHDALVLLKNIISIPKLLYLLRTSNCYNHPLLLQFHTILKSGLSTTFNIDFDETQWIQATLPVNDGGLGIRCANTLATSAFLASAALMHSIQQSILPSSHNQVPYQDLVSIEAIWSSLSPVNTPDQPVQCFQKAWDSPIVKKLSPANHAFATSDVDRARLKAACAHPLSGDWLQAPPIASVGLLLSVEEIHLAVAYRLSLLSLYLRMR